MCAVEIVHKGIDLARLRCGLVIPLQSDCLLRSLHTGLASAVNPPSPSVRPICACEEDIAMRLLQLF